MSGCTVATCSHIGAEWQPQGWAVVIDTSAMMLNGQVANSISALDVSTRGDLLFQFSNGVNSLVVRRGGTYYQVHSFFRPTPHGDFLIPINSMELRDDGTVYFLPVTEDDEADLYQGR